MSNYTNNHRARVWGLGMLGGALGTLVSSACVLIGDPVGQAEDAQCVLDYDECIGLGVDPSICQAIHDDCAGNGEGNEPTGGPEPEPDPDGCWDHVQDCLEQSGGDEQQCADLIDACQGGGDDDGGDDGNEPDCWDEVEACYEEHGQAPDCDALAEQCQGNADGGEQPDECAAWFEECANIGLSDDECLAQRPECGCAPDDPDCNGIDGCDVHYFECINAGENPIACEEAYQQCVANGPDPTGELPPQQACPTILEHCYADPDLQDVCSGLEERCQDESDCTELFFGCAEVGLEPDVPDQEPVQWDVPAECYTQLLQCLGG